MDHHEDGGEFNKPNEKVGKTKVVLLLKRAASHNYKQKRAQKILLANSNIYIYTNTCINMHKYKDIQIHA